MQFHNADMTTEHRMIKKYRYTVKPRCNDTRYTDNLHITIENSAPKIYIEKFPRYTDKL